MLETKRKFFLKQKFIASNIHYLGVFFNPKFKSLKPLPLKRKKAIYNHAEEFLLSTTDDVSAVYNSASSDHVYSTNASTETLIIFELAG